MRTWFWGFYLIFMLFYDTLRQFSLGNVYSEGDDDRAGCTELLAEDN